MIPGFLGKIIKTKTYDRDLTESLISLISRKEALSTQLDRLRRSKSLAEI